MKTLQKVWVKNFVESMSENFVKEMGEQRMGENFVKRMGENRCVKRAWVKTL